MITIIDYNTCNVGSIQNMLNKLGYESLITNNVKDIDKADKLILPGVGAFDKGMQNLKALGMISVLNEKIENGTPILGICLGYELLSKGSEEGGIEPGLGWIDADTIKFKFDDNSVRVPHMGWNTLKNTEKSMLFKGISDDHRFYFVHSYHVRCNDQSIKAAETDYSGNFTSAIEKNNIFGVQFHPEKSHKHGMVVLKNFAEYKN
jgi:imidazole glycerol-phosphate synthase subunit HisH